MNPTILLTLCFGCMVSAATNSTNSSTEAEPISNLVDGLVNLNNSTNDAETTDSTNSTTDGSEPYFETVLTCDDGNGTVSEQADNCELQARIDALEVTKIDAEEAVTREEFDNLKGDITNETLSDLIGGLMEEIASLKSELNDKIADLESDLEEDINNNADDLDALKAKLQRSAICGYRGDPSITVEGVTIKYDEIEEAVNDVGSTLTKDGIYTAGADGVYEMTVSGYSVTDKGERVEVDLKGTAIGDGVTPIDLTRTYMKRSGRVQSTSSASRIVSMKKGETIYLQYKEAGDAYLEQVKFCVKLYKAGL